MYMFMLMYMVFIPGPPIALEFLLIKKITTYFLRIEKFTSMNGKNRRIRIFSLVMVRSHHQIIYIIYIYDLQVHKTMQLSKGNSICSILQY